MNFKFSNIYLCFLKNIRIRLFKKKFVVWDKIKMLKELLT